MNRLNVAMCATTAAFFSTTCGLAAQSVAAFRPPAVPLVSCDPFFSVWSAADTLTGKETTHWAGAEQPISITLTADGKTWRLCGAEPSSVPALPQTGVEVMPLQTRYAFEGGGIRVKLVFSTAKLVEDLDVFSRPVTYVTARVEGAKEWKLGAAISPALATNDDKAQMVTNRCTVAGLPAMSIGRAEQRPLAYSGDRVRCDWGYAWLVGPGSAKDGEAHFLLAYDDVKAVQFFGDDLPAWWRRDGLSFTAMLEKAEAERASILKRLDAFDAEFHADLVKTGGEKYAKLASLAYRQTFAACKLAADRNNQPLYFSKEQDSNGCIGTVDILYPQSPQMLLVSPTLMRAMLAPVLVYASHPRWPWPFAPHDLGQYPLANQQRYGGGEKGKNESLLMPVEESGNMIICLAALAQAEGTAEFASYWWPTVTKWAEYLAKFGFDPGNQLCTDDFAGHLAHNANLAAKSIVALACYARLAETLGRTDVAAKYAALAKDMVPKWMDAAKGGAEGSYRLAYDRPGTWSMKYNLVWDRVLGLGLFPQSVFDAEANAYCRLAHPFGLPLDNRRTWTKTDWELWCAAFTDRRECFDAIVDRVYRFADETPSRVAFSDWYWTDNSKYVHFIGRSVIGGVFMPMLRNKAVWSKYASRDKAKTGVYAPLKERGRHKVIVPEGRSSSNIKWKYTFTEPPAGWEKPEFDDSGWQTGAGGFGTDGTPGAAVRTEWNTKNIWLRRHVTLAAAPRNPILSIHHDDDTKVWFNGILAGDYKGYSCDYEPQKVCDAAAKALKKGGNVIASTTYQNYGGQYIDYGLAVENDADAFNLASFNVRCPSPSDKGIHFWTNRFPYVVKVIKDHRFDIVGMQELASKQRVYLDEALGSGWGRIGVGRLPDDTGESMTIYYRKDRFECLATDTFWLSETPRVPGSRSWDTACPRCCTWGLFRDKRTGRKFRYYNTHLDHVSNEARLRGMQVLLAEMRRLSQGETVFLTGDMNAHYKHVPEADRTRLEAGGGPVIDAPETIGDPISAALHTLYDTRLKCETPHVGPLFTFSGYRPHNSCLIDFVFATGNVRVLRHITCHERPDGVHPSDHDAVMARMMIR
ncbi:MAG: DUF4965 domain-containing protein [Kiritimatiellae bacterium]|nr:DUF4965 domain-containing protein [Kiritimatiellia bacterium]